MGFWAELLRADDLVRLRVTGVNVHVDNGDPKKPALVVSDPASPAFLCFDFGPQAVAEHAFFEWDVINANAANLDQQGKALPRSPIDKTELWPPTGPPGPKMDHEPLSVPGHVPPQPPPKDPVKATAQLSGPSRLVFSVDAAASIPLTLSDLLDWSGLTPSVGPLAAIGPSPTSEEVAHAPAIQPPAATETAIELPYRLVISPNRDVAWRHRRTPFTSQGRTELWHTRLAFPGQELSPVEPAPLRAIWSPDYHPDNPPDATEADPRLGRTAMSANDRYQLVILTSAFHGWRVNQKFDFLRQGVGLGARWAPALPIAFNVAFVPQPFEADRLMLSALGGWLRSRGGWDPPFPAPLIHIPRDVLVNEVKRALNRPAVIERQAALDAGVAQLVRPVRPLRPLPAPDAPRPLDLSEWVHDATLGRDHYVRIVYEGELWPFRHRAALVKVTERKFMETADGTVGAYLMQRMFIVVREPVKEFTGRSTLYKKVRLTTLVTPNIAEPDILKGTQRSFWVTVMTAGSPKPQPFPFHGVGTGGDGQDSDFAAPMMFVSVSDLGYPGKPTVASGHYDDPATTTTRRFTVPGQKLQFARDHGNENTRLVAESLTFIVDSEGHPPDLLMAEVRIPQVQQLVGFNQTTTIAFDDDYLSAGFDAVSGVWAKVVKYTPASPAAADSKTTLTPTPLAVDFNAEQAGGFATPNQRVTALTRELGPIGGTLADAKAGTFNPAEYFKNAAARLFGTFDLADLLLGGGMATDAPKITTASELDALLTKFDWKPAIGPKNLGIASFTPHKANGFTVEGRVLRPFDPKDKPTTDFHGTLEDFDVSILQSVLLHVDRFEFQARTGSKVDIKVKFRASTPLEFTGDLEFVQDIRNVIPPDLFGDGPSIDLTTEGVRVGFGFALPPLTVCVFSLRDVKLGAALTLPFLDGKPVFDFNVSERAHPFVLTVSFFAGGGFFHLQLDTGGMKSLEAALEFGAAAAIDIGVASGEVHMMAGIYFSLQVKEGSKELKATLSGYLRVGGSLSVLGLVSISVEFNLSFTYVDPGKAFGRATLTVQVKVACFSKSVDLTVERGFGGSTDPTFRELVPAAGVWAEYVGCFA